MSGGIASLDVDGDDVADTGSALTDLGIDATELAALGSEYSAGKVIWRSTLRHFSPWDLNWGFGPPPGAEQPPPPDPGDGPPEDPCTREGSIIGCETRTLGEQIPIVGTPFNLRYQSDRSPGYLSTITFPITGGTPLDPAPLRVHVVVVVAGRRYAYVRPATPNSYFTFTWDGVDAYGRKVANGSHSTLIQVGYEYAGTENNSTGTFGAAGGGWISGDRVERTVTIWSLWRTTLMRAESKEFGFGGWTLDVHHLLDNQQTLLRGDGKRQRVSPLAYTIKTIAGGGSSGLTNYGDGGPALSAYLGQANDMVRAPDGTIYVAQEGFFLSGGRIRKIAPDGTITTIAGLPPVTARTDGMAALHAQIWPTNLAVSPDGTLYFSEGADGPGNAGYNRVWKIEPGATPTLRLVAGDGTAGSSGDGGPATTAQLSKPRSIGFAPDGALFIADMNNHRIRRVDPGGTIMTHFVDVGNPLPVGMWVRDDGTMIVRRWSNDELVRIEPDGRAATMTNASSQPLTLRHACGLSTGGSFLYSVAIPLQDDSLLVTCNSRVALRSADGMIVHLAGGGSDSPDAGGLATNALFANAGSTVRLPGDDLLVLEHSGKLRQLHLPYAAPNSGELRMPSKDGSEVYEFTLSGRHLRTRTGGKGAPFYTFGYDGNGLLTSITDGTNNNTTTIARSGSTITITAPHGQVTTLELDNGYLTSVTSPITSEVTEVVHSMSGLLTELVSPRGGVHRFEYAGNGRLRRDVNAALGSLGTRLAETGEGLSWTVAITSPEGRVTEYQVERGIDFGDTRSRERRTVSTGGLSTTTTIAVDGARSTLYPDGTKVRELTMASDSRWSGAVRYPTSTTIEVGYPTPTHSMTLTQSRSVTLSNPNDQFSVSSETITLSRSGSPNPLTRVFTAGSPSKWTTTFPSGMVIESTLDNLERVTQVAVLGSSPVTLHPIQYNYDARGRIDQITWGSRVYTTNFNGTTGWVDSTSAPGALNVTYNTRDANGRPTLVTLPGPTAGNPGARQLAMTYDVAGNVTSITPPSKPAHGFWYDLNERPRSYIAPDLSPSLDPKDTTYERDFDGLTVAASHPGNPVSYEYDSVGRLKTITGAVTTAFARDVIGRLTSVDTSDGVTLTNAFDGALLASQTQAVTGEFSHVVNKTYDNYLRVSSWDIDSGSAISIGYDADDVVSSAGGMNVTRGAGNRLVTATSVGTITDNFGWNAYGEVISHSVTGSATAYSVTYDRDAAGRIHEKTETIGGVPHSYRYEYDTSGRLAEVYEDGALTPTRAWTYDENGNRSDGTHDEQDRLESHGGVSYAYTNNGELSSKTIGGSTTTFSYDAFGNLCSVTRPSPLPEISYIVDGVSRRLGKKVGGTLVQGFVYDGTRIVAQLDGLGTVVSQFVYVLGGHSPDLMLQAGTTYRIVKDHLGSPRMVVNASTGAVMQRLDYDEWGNATESGTTAFQPFGFAGGLWDRDTGLVRFGARDYDPTTGRWTTKDRSRFGGGLNFYAYAENDPVNLIDPTGYGPIGAAIGGGIGATAGAAAGFLLGGGSGLAGIAGGPAVVVTVPAGAIVGSVAGLFAGGAVGAFWGDRAEDALRDALFAEEHTKNARPSTKGKHQKGRARNKRDYGNEKGDEDRRGATQASSESQGAVASEERVPFWSRLR